MCDYRGRIVCAIEVVRMLENNPMSLERAGIELVVVSQQNRLLKQKPGAPDSRLSGAMS